MLKKVKKDFQSINQECLNSILDLHKKKIGFSIVFICLGFVSNISYAEQTCTQTFQSEKIIKPMENRVVGNISGIEKHTIITCVDTLTICTISNILLKQDYMRGPDIISGSTSISCIKK